MDIISAIIIGVVQGLTEFLPVSSSAHLVFIQHILNVPQSNLAFDVLLHVGTLVAVVWYFYLDIIKLIKAWILSIGDLFNKKFISGLKNDSYKKLAWFVIIATIPAGLVGILFESQIESAFTSIMIPGFFLLITGALLYISQRMNSGKVNLEELSLKEAIIIGCGQACAILPGLSRSGTTIAAGLFLGLDKEFAARFSFILSIPAILGATLVQAKDIGYALDSNLFAMVFGFLASVISGYFAIKWLLKLIQERNLDIFAYYCWIVGAIVLVGTLIGFF